jgi:hypothetical protein
MSITSNLPLPLAPEIYVAAAYLLNRTPTRTIGWKTPFEIAYSKQPSIAHLRVYGCCAYALRPQIPRGDKLSPQALIGYLVGYDSSNIYRVWLPNATSRAHQGKVIWIQDVTFKKDLFFQHRDESDPLLQGEELKAITYTLHISALQDAEDSSEDEYDTASEPSRIENGPPSDTHTKSHESYDEVPLLPTPASTPHQLRLDVALYQTSNLLLKHQESGSDKAHLTRTLHKTASLSTAIYVTRISFLKDRHETESPLAKAAASLSTNTGRHL